MRNFSELKCSSVFNNFKKISEIPRGSGNEKEISDYLVDFAKSLKLEVVQDKALNVIIKKPASIGYENAPTVIIQGHMDMVCEKNGDTVHDFKKDPIELIVKEDYLYANGTTLGADNGIAVAYAMSLLEDNTLQHPTLEILLTTDEESGMTGAMAVLKENIKGKILINIDNEDEGYLLVSCAGGIRTKSSIKFKKEELGSKSLFSINIKGLKGGHSGCDINKWRGNSNKIIGRVLKDLLKTTEFNLVSLNGGSKNNAIPREAKAIIAIDERVKGEFNNLIGKWNEIIRKELASQDSDVRITSQGVINNNYYVMGKNDTKSIINLLYLYPNGVNTMSTVIEGLTESSTNLGVVTTLEEEVEFDSAVRSSITTLKDEIVERIKTITETFGGNFEANAGYPAWEYKEESEIREICKDVYKRLTGEEMKVCAIHAGVECGLFQERLGDIDMISFGPNMHDVHTPDEHLSISSTDNVWEYLLEVLKSIK